MKERLIHFDKFPNKTHVEKTSLMFVEDGKICDGCDEHDVKCASLLLISGGVSILCKDCIEGILDSLDASSSRDRKINKVLE